MCYDNVKCLRCAIVLYFMNFMKKALYEKCHLYLYITICYTFKSLSYDADIR